MAIISLEHGYGDRWPHKKAPQFDSVVLLLITDQEDIKWLFKWLASVM